MSPIALIAVGLGAAALVSKSKSSKPAGEPCTDCAGAPNEAQPEPTPAEGGTPVTVGLAPAPMPPSPIREDEPSAPTPPRAPRGEFQPLYVGSLTIPTNSRPTLGGTTLDIQEGLKGESQDSRFRFGRTANTGIVY